MPVASKLSRPDELQSVESCRASYKQSHWVQSCKHLSNPASKESTIAAQALVTLRASLKQKIQSCVYIASGWPEVHVIHPLFREF